MVTPPKVGYGCCSRNYDRRDGRLSWPSITIDVLLSTCTLVGSKGINTKTLLLKAVYCNLKLEIAKVLAFESALNTY